jgi:hypothetical protein
MAVFLKTNFAIISSANITGCILVKIPLGIFFAENISKIKVQIQLPIYTCAVHTCVNAGQSCQTKMHFLFDAHTHACSAILAFVHT